jgi:hypothetical protein
MAQTGWAWIGSPLYWARIIIGLVLPLAAIWLTRDVPVWLPPIILIGEFMGRMVFFKDTLHAAGNLGGLY